MAQEEPKRGLREPRGGLKRPPRRPKRANTALRQPQRSPAVFVRMSRAKRPTPTKFGRGGLPEQGPQMAQEEAKRGPRGPRGGSQKASKTAQERQHCQECPKTAPEEPGRFCEDVPSDTADTDQVWSGWDPQKGPKDGPRRAQEGRKRAPRGSKKASKTAKESQESPKTALEEPGRFREDVPSETANTDQVWSGWATQKRPTDGPREA